MRTTRSAQRPTVGRRDFLRATGLLVPAAAGLTFLSGCGGEEEPTGDSGEGGEGGTYMTALGFTLSFVEAIIAKEQGYFDDLGLPLEIQGGQGTATTLQALLGKSADVTRANPINTTIAAANDGAPIRSIGTIRQKSQFDVVSLSSAPINEPADLEGKVCGIVSAGGATENLLDIMMVDAGIDPASVERPITGIGGSAFELARDGAVDAWISVDADRATIERTNPGDLVYFNTGDFTTVPSDSYAVTQEMIDSGSDLPARFLAGVMEAMRFGADEASWETVIADLKKYNNEIDADLALEEMPLIVESWMAAGEDKILSLNEDTWQKGQESLKAAGMIEDTVELDQLIYGDYYEQALSL